MTTANKITLVRIAMIPFFIWFALQNSAGSQIVALILFCVASFTDFLDGYIARKYNQVTDFGKFVDPLADQAARHRSPAHLHRKRHLSFVDGLHYPRA